MKKLVLLLCLLLSAPLIAQDRPISGTTVQTTDTTANSLLVGCAIGSTTCTGGIKSGLVTLATGQAGAAGPTIYATATQLTMAGGSAGYLWNATNNSTSLMTLSNAGLLSLSAAGAHTISASNNNNQGLTITNSSNGASASAVITLANDTPTNAILMQAGSAYTGVAAYQAATALRGTAANGIHIAAEHASGVIKFYSGGINLRWGINAAGDFTVGASSHIALSNGTPTVASGFWTTTNTVNGSDYAFSVTGTGSNTASGVINFGHTWSSTPVCVATNSTGTAAVIITAISTTSVSMSVGAGTLATPFNVICHGY